MSSVERKAQLIESILRSWEEKMAKAMEEGDTGEWTARADRIKDWTQRLAEAKLPSRKILP